MATGGSITWRFAIDGQDQARDGMRSLGDTGAAAAAQVGTAWSAAGGVADQTAARYRALAEEIQRSAAARTATPVQQQINVATDARTGSSAKDSASVFEQQFAAAEQLRNSINPLAVAERALSTEQARVNGLFNAGLISATEHAAGLRAAQATYRASTEALHEMGGASASTVRELLVLAREASRGNFTRMGGSATILAQNLGLLNLAMTPVGATIIGLTAVTVGAAAAMIMFSAAQDKASLSLRYLGVSSGATLQQVNAIADEISKAGDVSRASARDSALQLASTGQVGAESLGKATAAVRDFALATGQDMPKATAALSQALADPARGIVTLNSLLHLWDDAQVQTITHMAELGDKAGAQGQILDGLAKHLGDAKDQVNSLDRAFRGIIPSIQNFWETLGNDLDREFAPNDAQKLASLQAELQRRRTWEATGQGAIPRTQPDIEAEMAPLEAKLKAAADAAAARTRIAQQNDRSVAVGAAVDASDPKEKQIRDIQARNQDLQNALKNPVPGQRSNADIQAAMKQNDAQIAQLEKSRQHIDKHAESLKRDSDAEIANAAAALVAADAYSKSLAAGGEAEAKQKATADAIRKGIAPKDEIARQSNERGADAARDGEKNAAQLRDQTAAMQAYNDMVAAGVLTYKQAQQAAEDESKLKPLLIAQNEGDAKTRGAVTHALQDYRAALADAHAEEQRNTAERALSEQQDKGAQLDQQIAVAKLPKGSRAHDDMLAQIEAENDLRSKGVSDLGSDAAQASIAQAVANAGKQRQLSSAQYVTDTTDSQKDQQAVLEAQIDLITKGANEQALVLGQLKQEQELRKNNVSASSAEGQAILAASENQIRLNQSLEAGKANFAEFKDSADHLVDDLGQAVAGLAGGMKEFGQVGLAAIKEIEEELIKLAILNPIKNGLFGENLPTLGSMSGFFGNFFGGGGSSVAAMNGSLNNIPDFVPDTIPGFNAEGTSSWRGGPTWVGEEGPELLNLPYGASVYSNRRSQGMAAQTASPTAQGAGKSGAGDVHLHNHTGMPMQATKSTSSNGDMTVKLTPYGQQMVLGTAKDGTLERAMRMMPNTKVSRP